MQRTAATGPSRFFSADVKISILVSFEVLQSLLRQMVSRKDVKSSPEWSSLAGLWTTVAGAIAAITELWIVFSHGHDPWVSVMLAGLGAALALLGPGAWSVDARLYGWKRIEIRRPDK